MWRVHVELARRAGRLGELAAAVGTAGCDIVSLQVVGDDGSSTDELLVEAPEPLAPAALVRAVEGAGFPCTLLVPAGDAERSDSATTALTLARMVVADPGSTAAAVATMLQARLVDPAAEHPDGYVRVLRVGGHRLHLERAWPFTATELSRAAALLELAAQLEMRAPGPAPSPAWSRQRSATPDATPVMAATADT